MCGIVAFIGKSKNPQASYDLITSLMIKTEIRGDDASGFWATEDRESDDSPIYFSKEPVKSTLFVQSAMWKALQGKPLNLFLGHCRKSTCRGQIGHENINRNNHPFLSKDDRTALVHNGVIPEYEMLRSKYDTMSDCDSEILLRMIERAEGYPKEYIREELKSLKVKGSSPEIIEKLDENTQLPYFAERLIGMRDIFSRVNYGAMAVALGERLEDGTRALWLFRDKERPLHVIDMRKTLGQVFVCSDKKIWREAVDATPSAKHLVKGNTPIIEYPVNYIWLLTIDPKGKLGVRKWKVNKQRKNGATFENERPEVNFDQLKTRKPVTLITNLNHENHEVIQKAPLENKPLAAKSTTAVTSTAVVATTPKTTEKKTELASPSQSQTPSPPTEESRLAIKKLAWDHLELQDSPPPCDLLSDTDTSPLSNVEVIPSSHSISPKMEVTRRPIFTEDEEEKGTVADDLSHKKIPLGHQKKMTTQKPQDGSVDPSALDRYKTAMSNIKTMLFQMEQGIDAKIKAHKFDEDEFSSILSGLEDIEKEITNQSYTVTHDSSDVARHGN